MKEKSKCTKVCFHFFLFSFSLLILQAWQSIKLKQDNAKASTFQINNPKTNFKYDHFLQPQNISYVYYVTCTLLQITCHNLSTAPITYNKHKHSLCITPSLHRPSKISVHTTPRYMILIIVKITVRRIP